MQSINDTTVQRNDPVDGADLRHRADRRTNDQHTDMRNKSAVAVVGADIVDNLMSGADPLDKEIRIDGWTYRSSESERRRERRSARAWTTTYDPDYRFQKQNGAHKKYSHFGQGLGPRAGVGLSDR